MPHVISNGVQTYLVFLVQGSPIDWDACGQEMLSDPDFKLDPEQYCIVTVRGHNFRFGSPNDEVWHGHYLHDRGMEGYTAQVVVNSPWLAEVRAINSVHSRYDPASWEAMKHFIFWFHDDTFECLAESLQFEVSTEELRDVIAGLKIRLVG